MLLALQKHVINIFLYTKNKIQIRYNQFNCFGFSFTALIGLKMNWKILCQIFIWLSVTFVNHCWDIMKCTESILIIFLDPELKKFQYTPLAFALFCWKAFIETGFDSNWIHILNQSRLFFNMFSLISFQFQL